MNPWAPIDLPTGMVDLLNMLCELAIFLAMLTHWTLLPGVVATQRDTQCATEHADRILLSILLNDLVPHNWPCEKMDTVFFRISRSCRVLSSSRLSRRFSSSNAVWCPLPGNASAPCSANSLRHWWIELSEMPSSRATWVIGFPLV